MYVQYIYTVGSTTTIPAQYTCALLQSGTKREPLEHRLLNKYKVKHIHQFRS